MVPLLPLPAFGGTPWRQIWPQFRHGFRCYLPSDGTPAAARSYLLGDDDGGSGRLESMCPTAPNSPGKGSLPSDFLDFCDVFHGEMTCCAMGHDLCGNQPS